MADFERRLTALEQARKEIEDSLLVMAHLEARQSQMLKEQAEYLASHEARRPQAEQRNREIDERIAKLVSAIGALTLKLQ